MFRNLFNPENSLMITLGWISDCIFLSLFWLLCCFPLVTAGASFAALYDAAYRSYREGEKNSWQRFWQVFRSSLKPGFVPTLLFLGLFALLVKGVIALWNLAVAGGLSWMLFAAGAVLAALGLGVLSVLFPMLSRFENGVGTLLKNTLLLSLANLPRTLGLGILNAAAVFLCVRFVVPLFFLPALAALLGSLLIEPMFKPYMK